MISVQCGNKFLTGGYNPGRAGDWAWDMGDDTTGMRYENWRISQPNEDDNGKLVQLAIDVNNYDWYDKTVNDFIYYKFCYVCEVN